MAPQTVTTRELFFSDGALRLIALVQAALPPALRLRHVQLKVRQEHAASASPQRWISQQRERRWRRIRFQKGALDVIQMCQKSRRIGCVIPFVSYNAGSRNLSFDFFWHICSVFLTNHWSISTKHLPNHWSIGACENWGWQGSEG